MFKLELKLCKILNQQQLNSEEFFNSWLIWLKSKKKWLKGKFINYLPTNVTHCQKKDKIPFFHCEIILKMKYLIHNFLFFFNNRIDSNIEHTELNVEAAHAEILKYFQSVTGNRWLMIKIFAVLIFFFIFFVVFLAQNYFSGEKKRRIIINNNCLYYSLIIFCNAKKRKFSFFYF